MSKRDNLVAAIIFLALALTGALVGCDLLITSNNDNTNQNVSTPTPSPSPSPTVTPCYPAGAPCGQNTDCCALACVDSACL